MITANHNYKLLLPQHWWVGVGGEVCRGICIGMGVRVDVGVYGHVCTHINISIFFGV